MTVSVKHLSDEEAWKKANLINCSGDKKTQPVKRVKTQKPNADLNTMTFDQLKEKYAEAMERLAAYRALPDKQILAPQIRGISNFIAAIKVVMKKKASPEQAVFLTYLNEVEKEANTAKILRVELEQVRSSQFNERQRVKAEHIRLSHERSLLIHNQFKKLVQEHLSHNIYVSIIQEASAVVDNLLMNKGAENA